MCQRGQRAGRQARRKRAEGGGRHAWALQINRCEGCVSSEGLREYCCGRRGHRHPDGKVETNRSRPRNHCFGEQVEEHGDRVAGGGERSILHVAHACDQSIMENPREGGEQRLLTDAWGVDGGGKDEVEEVGGEGKQVAEHCVHVRISLAAVPPPHRRHSPRCHRDPWRRVGVAHVVGYLQHSDHVPAAVMLSCLGVGNCSVHCRSDLSGKHLRGRCCEWCG